MLPFRHIRAGLLFAVLLLGVQGAYAQESKPIILTTTPGKVDGTLPTGTQVKVFRESSPEVRGRLLEEDKWPEEISSETKLVQEGDYVTTERAYPRQDLDGSWWHYFIVARRPDGTLYWSDAFGNSKPRFHTLDAERAFIPVAEVPEDDERYGEAQVLFDSEKVLAGGQELEPKAEQNELPSRNDEEPEPSTDRMGVLETVGQWLAGSIPGLGGYGGVLTWVLRILALLIIVRLIREPLRFFISRRRELKGIPLGGWHHSHHPWYDYLIRLTVFRSSSQQQNHPKIPRTKKVKRHDDSNQIRKRRGGDRKKQHKGVGSGAPRPDDISRPMSQGEYSALRKENAKLKEENAKLKEENDILQEHLKYWEEVSSQQNPSSLSHEQYTYTPSKDTSSLQSAEEPAPSIISIDASNQRRPRSLSPVEAVASTFKRWCNNASGQVNRLSQFERQLRQDVSGASVQVLYRELNTLQELEFSEDARNPVEYWLVKAGGDLLLFPRPLNAERFKELEPVYKGNATPQGLREIRPARMQHNGSQYTLVEPGEIH